MTLMTFDISSGTEAPTAAPTEAPTAAPTEAPSADQTEAPTAAPTEAPPAAAPTEAPPAAAPSNGTVLSHQKVSFLMGGFTGSLAGSDSFGRSSASVGGDLNGDGVLDLVVGAPGDDDGGSSTGAVYILFFEGIFMCVQLVFLVIVVFVCILVVPNDINDV